MSTFSISLFFPIFTPLPFKVSLSLKNKLNFVKINIDSYLNKCVYVKLLIWNLFFVFYSPLQIIDQEKQPLSTNAFLVPRWGGVLVLNTNETELQMKVVMSTFVTQFRQLIGLDHYDKNLVFILVSLFETKAIY